MEPLSTIAIHLGILDTILEVGDILRVRALKGLRLCELYGSPGLFLFLFGNQTAWKLQAQIVGGIDDDAVMAFKKSVQDECTMISIAVRIPRFRSHMLKHANLSQAAIVAQIAITAMSLDKLDETHW